MAVPADAGSAKGSSEPKSALTKGSGGIYEASTYIVGVTVRAAGSIYCWVLSKLNWVLNLSRPKCLRWLIGAIFRLKCSCQARAISRRAVCHMKIQSRKAECAKRTQSGDIQTGRHCQAKWRAAECESESSWGRQGRQHSPVSRPGHPFGLIHTKRHPRLKGIERNLGPS